MPDTDIKKADVEVANANKQASEAKEKVAVANDVAAREHTDKAIEERASK
jgi:hypothetical protein